MTQEPGPMTESLSAALRAEREAARLMRWLPWLWATVVVGFAALGAALITATRIQSIVVLAVGNLVILPIGAAVLAAGWALGQRYVSAQWLRSEELRSASELAPLSPHVPAARRPTLAVGPFSLYRLSKEEADAELRTRFDR